jgi:hypothetical protein
MVVALAGCAAGEARAQCDFPWVEITFHDPRFQVSEFEWGAQNEFHFTFKTPFARCFDDLKVAECRADRNDFAIRLSVARDDNEKTVDVWVVPASQETGGVLTACTELTKDGEDEVVYVRFGIAADEERNDTPVKFQECRGKRNRVCAPSGHWVMFRE